ncbi:GNAT family N-acetyltransferase [Kribbella speibonae]|uniref:GNAT family N-acetyltransferase n=1 Tax=Kribbella speibonae TaxID=1572660 RepID=A0ABY2A6D1_9ACTN|nr:GNAT family N-acetyltransferase [Kribbella speibonae]TCC24651.1 GNAT family N-acetyltransferase [Kribbella speibonae]
MDRQLIPPTVHLHERWLEAHAEWGAGLHEDGFGLGASDEVESLEGFAAWVARLTAGSDRGTLRWIVEGGQVQGGIALRHELNEVSGHIGYGIRPSARGRGLATWALGEMLELARGRGMERVMLVCLAGNVASVRTIERHGGVLDEVRRTGNHTVRHYWIDLRGN